MSRISVGANLSGPPVVRHTVPVDSPGTILLTEELHAGRIVLADSIYTTAGPTFTLPRAIGSNNKYTVINNAVQSGTSIVVNVSKIDVMTGIAVMLEAAGGTDDVVFYTAATSDTVTWNATTKGGLSGDMVEALDMRQDAAGTGVWLVRVTCFTSGDTVTPFSAAVS